MFAIHYQKEPPQNKKQNKKPCVLLKILKAIFWIHISKSQERWHIFFFFFNIRVLSSFSVCYKEVTYFWTMRWFFFKICQILGLPQWQIKYAKDNKSPFLLFGEKTIMQAGVQWESSPNLHQDLSKEGF